MISALATTPSSTRSGGQRSKDGWRTRHRQRMATTEDKWRQRREVLVDRVTARRMPFSARPDLLKAPKGPLPKLRCAGQRCWRLGRATSGSALFSLGRGSSLAEGGHSWRRAESRRTLSGVLPLPTLPCPLLGAPCGDRRRGTLRASPAPSLSTFGGDRQRYGGAGRTLEQVRTEENKQGH